MDSNQNSPDLANTDAPMADKSVRDLIEEHIFPKLDPDFVAYFAGIKARSPTVSYAPIEHVRANPETTQSPCSLDASTYPGVQGSCFASEDGFLVPVQLYYPDSEAHGLGPYPVHLNFHGQYILKELDSPKYLPRV